MTEHDIWKTVLAYAAGITILAVCLILALFFPNWYGSWQDEQLIGKVTLESRENIEFLDGDSLDIAGRMKKLGEATSIEWGFGAGYDGEYNDLNVDDWAYANANQQKNIQRCRALVKQWWEAGLLPEDCSSWIDERDHLILYIEQALYVNDSVLPVCFLAFANEHIEDADLYDSAIGDEDVSNEDQVDLLLVLMDAEKDMIYYASFAGAVMQKAMLHEFGYESEQQLRENLADEAIVLKKPDITAYDFAAVCGAESAKITAEPGQLELRAALQYDNYEAYAGRSLIWNEGGYGQAILFGTPRWQSLIRQLLGALGSEELLMTTELWCNLLLGQISHDEAQDLLNTASIYQDYSGVNAEVFEAANAAETEIAEEYEQIERRRIKKAHRRNRMSMAAGVAGIFLTAIFLKQEIERSKSSEVGLHTYVRQMIQGISGEQEERLLVLVNKKHKMPDDYEPVLHWLNNGSCAVAEEMYESLSKMLSDGSEEGRQFVVASGYRSQETQKQLLEEDIADDILKLGLSYQEAYEKETRETMPPGYSEHETGLAVDIVALDYQILDEKQELTEENQWLREHCSEYGFILRYPRGKEDITEIDYESWHFRYVGMAAAQEIAARGITLEEYLGQ